MASRRSPLSCWCSNSSSWPRPDCRCTCGLGIERASRSRWRCWRLTTPCRPCRGSRCPSFTRSCWRRCRLRSGWRRRWMAGRERPALALEWLGGPRGAEAAAWLLAPAAGLPLLAPDVLALAAPSFLVLFLQDRESTFAGHWSAPFLPICWFAAAAALGRLASLCGRRRDLALGLAVVAVALASGLSYARYSLFPGGRGFDVEHFVWTEREDDLARAAALVPPAAPSSRSRRSRSTQSCRPNAGSAASSWSSRSIFAPQPL